MRRATSLTSPSPFGKGLEIIRYRVTKRAKCMLASPSEIFSPNSCSQAVMNRSTCSGRVVIS